MFDISFAELMIIAVVGLLVIGPDKLPQVARTLGAFMGRLQRYVAQVKDEVSREARFEDLQKLQQEIKESARQVKSSIMDGASEVRSNVDAIENSVKPKPQSRAKTPSVKKTSIKKPSTPAVKKPVKAAVVKPKNEKA